MIELYIHTIEIDTVLLSALTKISQEKYQKSNSLLSYKIYSRHKHSSHVTNSLLVGVQNYKTSDNGSTVMSKVSFKQDYIEQMKEHSRFYCE